MPKPDFTDVNDKITELIRVDQAGEFGAQRIYAGQLRYTKNSKERTAIEVMMQQELVHLNYFESQLRAKQVRPTLLFPLWKSGGYLLGSISAMLGVKIAMLTTESVEEVIEEHYQTQIDYLTEKLITAEFDDEALLNNIKQFQEDEIEHKHIATENGSQQAPLAKLWAVIIKKICIYAIGLSKKI